MKIKVLGKVFYLVFRSLRSNWGYCDRPDKKRRREVVIHKDLTGRKKLEIIIHELLHACSFPLDEEFIDGSARDIARVLWDVGYRDLHEVVHPEDH